MDTSDIQRVTKEYWAHFEPSQLDEAMKYYVCEGHTRLNGKSLLAAELDYAKQVGHITARPCEMLALLAGFSLEPLLQSVCVYQPQKIGLLLNQEGYINEEWHDFARHVTEAIEQLAAKGLIAQAPQFLGDQSPDRPGYPTADKPGAVFETLVRVLHNETDVVIDVTGGKKSMVSGAYLYAAYSGARISYVDFDEYDPKHRRPYGYSCKIGELANPYQEFALREWERVRALYGRYQFREARKVLNNDVLPSMKQVVQETEQPMLKLAAFLGYYEQWEHGDYRGARQAVQSLPNFEQPSAVTALGDQWFEISDIDFANKPKHFYGNLPALQVYVGDELARIRRLIDFNEDYRSAFLRAGGVNEIVMLARVVRLVTNPMARDSLLHALEEKTPSAYDVFKALTGKNIKIGTDRKCDISFKNAPGIIVPHPTPMNSWWKATKLFNADDGWDTFLTRRNELAHKYFTVPREWVEDALKFVQANFEDFIGRPVADLGLRTTALPWSELCNLCGVIRYLPTNLREEAQP